MTEIKISITTPKESDTEQRHTEEIQEIIGAPPSWLIKWGITLYFLVLVLILSLSEVINYPDTVNSQLRIHTMHMPEVVIIKEHALLLKLWVQNNQNVRAGQPLITIKTQRGDSLIKARQQGQLNYAGILRPGEELAVNLPIFHIVNSDDDFFGEMPIPTGTIGKIKPGNEVLVKLRNYPYQEYGMLHGTIKYIADNPLRDGDFIAEVDFKNYNKTDMHRTLAIKQGMMAETEIITEKKTLFTRLTSSLFKNFTH